MALKNEFDSKSYGLVLWRTMVGAIFGAVPGIAFIILNSNQSASNPFGMMLIQTGSIIGALVMGFASLSGTIVAALKNRGTGPKPNRIKEYLHPETLPPIPPSPKAISASNEQTELKQPKLEQQPLIQPIQVEALPSAPVTMPSEPQSFEDYDR